MKIKIVKVKPIHNGGQLATIDLLIDFEIKGTLKIGDDWVSGDIFLKESLIVQSQNGERYFIPKKHSFSNDDGKIINYSTLLTSKKLQVLVIEEYNLFTSNEHSEQMPMENKAPPQEQNKAPLIEFDKIKF